MGSSKVLKVKMKDKFYQRFRWWRFLLLGFLLSFGLITSYLSTFSGFEYTLESPIIGDHLLVVHPRYIEYTSTNDGKSTELLWDDDNFTLELWDNHNQLFLFEKETK
jgi:hypothetical protein